MRLEVRTEAKRPGIVPLEAPPASERRSGQPWYGSGHPTGGTVVYAVDIGGTNVRLGLAALSGGESVGLLAAERHTHGPEEAPADVIAGWLTALESMRGWLGIDPGSVAGLGISFPGLMDGDRVAAWPNRPAWNGYPLQRELDRLFGLPVRIEEDANALALGEYRFGRHGSDHLLSVTVGTGIGAGLVADGRLFRGRGWAGELGHIRLLPGGEGPSCVCGQTGCLQALASGPAILRKARRLAPGVVTEADDLRLIADYALRGSSWARTAVRDAGRWLASGLAAAVRMYDMDTVVLGGGVTAALGGQLLEPVKEELDGLLAGWPRPAPTVRASGFGDDGGLLGAAAAIADTITDKRRDWIWSNG